MVKPRHISLNFITVPLASVLLLLATKVFNSQTVRDGIVGTGGVSPLNIMALFISLVRVPITAEGSSYLKRET